MEIIKNNPYRILGVFSNSRRQEIVANKSRATAFLKVSRPVEFPLDLKGVLPQLTRTLNSMNEAEAHLSISKEQIKYAQFWFIKLTPKDDDAFNHLLAGNMKGAIEMWSKQESVSSLQNKIVCYLIDNKPGLAIRTAEKLYKTFGDSYISKIDANSTLYMAPIELMHQFVDSLSEEFNVNELLSYEMGEETKAYVSNRAVGPLVNKISFEVERTKRVDHKDPKARIDASKKLVIQTKEPFNQLKRLLPLSDPQLQMIADKLGLEILQCGIDYYNNSEDDDAAFNAMTMQKYAQSIVVGTLAKQRCEENVKILQKIIDELPPKAVLAEDRAIKAELNKFVKLPDKISYALMLLNNTKPHLQSIKNKLGVTNGYYLKLSTQIVSNALHNIVVEVNDAQQSLKDLIETRNDPMHQLLSGFSYSIDYYADATKIENQRERLKTTLRKAWRATIMMDKFDLETNFKTVYIRNRETLKSLCEQLYISTFVIWVKELSIIQHLLILLGEILLCIIISLLVYAYDVNNSYWEIMITPYVASGLGIGTLLAMLILGFLHVCEEDS